MSERRYTEDEVAAIFARAAEPASARQQPAAAAGPTLAELQEIGREVGIAPDAVARAALSLHAPGAAVTRRFFGLPLGVGRTVDLGRDVAQQEWERLVVDLRTLFAARGRLEEHGGLRQWSNGNLHVMLEPVTGGHRLRLHTLKRSAANRIAGGFLTLGGGAAIALMDLLMPGLDDGAMRGALFLGILGIAMTVSGVAALPAWARRRREQFDAIVARVTSADNDVVR